MRLNLEDARVVSGREKPKLAKIAVMGGNLIDLDSELRGGERKINCSYFLTTLLNCLPSFAALLQERC